MTSRTFKSVLILLFVIVGFAIISTPSGHAGSEIKVTYNNSQIVFASKPVTLNGTTYVETRPFIQPIGLQVGWVNKTKFRLSNTNLTIDMEVNIATAYVNGRKTTLAAAPTKIGSTLFLPVRPIAALTNHNLIWIAAANTIAITSKAAQIPALPSVSYKVIAYYPSWATYQDFDVSNIAAPNITHVNYAFANIKDGKVVLGDPWTDKSNFRQLQTLKKANPKLKALISVGGWTWSGQFSDISLSQYSRTKFADSAVQFIRDYDFDGVDLDWEYPVSGGLTSNHARPADKHNFTLLLRTIRDKLDAVQLKNGKTYSLTIAAGSFPAYVTNTEIDQVADIVDWINLMTYDYHGDWEDVSNHNAPLYADPNDPVNAKSNINSTVNLYLKAGVPSNKLVLGIPFYGRSWTNCGAANQGQYQTCNGVADGVIADGIHEYGNLENQGWINGKGYVRYWNDNSKVPWLYNKSTGTFVSYEDPESIAYKAQYIKSKGLGGAMLWELSQDFNQTLLNKLLDSLK
ncbi:glycosyl hydrolase family 18 protein [Cohnella silvisoli]|uniref:chitinase n=1 Tax=Cohnella silvisoli TaxID=2873699 RepID=A0ABV1KT81_9BACL|nr:glycosyl hydrolase family 18 protein [Cohnella silvisoli]MCD9022954.1 chitinase [Cohnella silvisoli]